MASLTSRFGLHKFGGGIGGAITDDGSAFTAIDPDVIDAILHAFETHNHQGGARLGDPSTAPSLSLATTGGALAANTTYYYRVSFIDEFGLETAASDEVWQSTPGTVDKPGAPIVITGSGGSLNPGVYYFGLTAIANDNETSLGPVVPVTITDQFTAIITFPVIPTGSDHISVWRQGPNEVFFSRIATVVSTDTSYTDDGSVASDPLAYDPSHQPPSTNLTNATNVITITAPDPTTVAADPSLVKGWRIYRTTVSGSYPAQSLLAEVRTTVNEDGTGGLVTTFADNGGVVLSQGYPLSLSQTLTPTVAIAVAALAEVVADLPAAGEFQDGTLAITTSDDTLWASLSDTWVAIGGSAEEPSFIHTAGMSHAVGTSGDAVQVYGVTTSVDSGGHDLTYVGAVEIGTGDQFQVNTDGTFSFYVSLSASGYTAGDLIQVDASVMNSGSVFSAFVPNFSTLLPVRSDGTCVGTLNMPPMHLKAGMRVAFVATPYYASAHDALTVYVGADMLNGKAAKAEVYPAVVGTSATPSTASIDVAWTVRGTDVDYTILTYDLSTGVVTDTATGVTSSPHTISGMSPGSYSILILARKVGTDTLEIYSTPAVVSATIAALVPPVPGPYSTAFTGVTDGTLLSAFDSDHWNDANGNPSGILSITSTHLHNSGTGGPRFGLLDLGVANKSISFTHGAAASGSPLVVYLATDSALGNPNVSLGLDGSTTAPVIDHYASGGAHTAITMTATGAASDYRGSTDSIEVRINGTTVTIFQSGTSVWTATLPSASPGTHYGFGFFNNAHYIDNLLVTYVPNFSVTPTDSHSGAPDIASSLVGSILFDTTSFTNTESAPWDIGFHNSAWVKYICTTSGTAQVDTIGTPVDTYLYVLDHTGATVIEDDNGGGNATSAARFSCASGETYYIAVATVGSGGTTDMRLNFNVPG